MAVPTFRTWADDDILFGSQLNTDIRDNGKFLLYPPQVDAYASAPTAVLNATLTALPANSEFYDRVSGTASTMHDLVTNNTRITPNAAGVYLVVPSITYAAQAVSAGFRYMYIRKNGTLYYGAVQEYVGVAGWNNVTVTMQCPYTFDMNGTTDYLEVIAFHGAGATLNVSLTQFSVTRIG